MIAQNQWFSRRKYGGWGLAPKTWQGWAYILCAVGVLLIVQLFLPDTPKMQAISTGIWVFLLLIDIIPVMITLKKDEREIHVEAISERNAAWFMSIVLVTGIVYEIVRADLLSKQIEWNYFMIVALF